jgi:hypothetical protein
MSCPYLVEPSIHTPAQQHLHLLCSGGGDLGSYLRRYGSVPEPVAHHLLVQLADGLKVLRANNLIHVSTTLGATPYRACFMVQ